MAKKEEKRERIKKKLLHKYRLVVLNEDTFEERLSFKLNRLNVFVLGSLFATFLIAGTIAFIFCSTARDKGAILRHHYSWYGKICQEEECF